MAAVSRAAAAAERAVARVSASPLARSAAAADRVSAAASAVEAPVELRYGSPPLHNKRRRHAGSQAELTRGGPVVGALARDGQAGERVGHRRQVVDHENVGEQLGQAAVGGDPHLLPERLRGAEAGRRLAAGARRGQQTCEAHSGRAQRFEQRPLVSPVGHGQGPGVLRQGGAQGQLVPGVAAHGRGQLDHAGVGAGQTQHVGVDLAQLGQRGGSVLAVGRQSGPLGRDLAQRRGGFG